MVVVVNKAFQLTTTKKQQQQQQKTNKQKKEEEVFLLVAERLKVRMPSFVLLSTLKLGA